MQKPPLTEVNGGALLVYCFDLREVSVGRKGIPLGMAKNPLGVIARGQGLTESACETVSGRVLVARRPGRTTRPASRLAVHYSQTSNRRRLVSLPKPVKQRRRLPVSGRR